MPVDLRPLDEALAHLETHLGLVSSPMAQENPKLALAFRTASIKSFEYCCALAIKAIERALTERAAQLEVVELANFRTMVRMAWEMALIENTEKWPDFREMRNATAHTYDDHKASEVLAGLPAFIMAIRFLIERLRDVPNAL